MKFWIKVEPGSRIPTGYGLAYNTPSEFRSWCCPIPINIFVGLLRNLYFWCVRGLRPSIERDIVQLADAQRSLTQELQSMKDKVEFVVKALSGVEGLEKTALSAVEGVLQLIATDDVMAWVAEVPK